MRMIRRVVGFSTLWLMGGIAIASPLHLEVDTKGMIAPFKIRNMPLHEFVKEYSRISGTRIQAAGPWESDLRGNVTLFFPRPLALEKFTEVFHQVLVDNGFSVIDAPMNAGWRIQRIRDVRDLPVPVYNQDHLPITRRIVTTTYELKYIRAEEVARLLRSFMMSTSRIIPFGGSQLAITDSGTNIHPKLTDLIRQMDTKEGAALLERNLEERLNQRECKPKEQLIQTLKVEKLEIGELASPEGFPVPVKKEIKK